MLDHLLSWDVCFWLKSLAAHFSQTPPLGAEVAMREGMVLFGVETGLFFGGSWRSVSHWKLVRWVGGPLVHLSRVLIIFHDAWKV